MKLLSVGLFLLVLLGCTQHEACRGYCVARGFDGGDCPVGFCFDGQAARGGQCACRVPSNAPHLMEGVRCTHANVDAHSAFPDPELPPEDPGTVLKPAKEASP